MITQTAIHKPPSRVAQYWALTKPRVTQLAVFCAVIGMFLATDGFPGWHVLAWGTIGIWLLAGAAFAVNCLIEAEVDARMARTARRATAMGELSTTQVLIFSAIIGGAGMGILYTMVNPLTMWLTFVTFVGYVAGGPAGALAITAGMFLPAFVFSLIFFERLEAVIENPALHRLLAGVAAAVVGVIAATVVQLGLATGARATQPIVALLLFGAAAWVAWRRKGAWVAPAIVAGGAMVGWLVGV